MNQAKFDTLEAALASVPKEVQPARDLWPAIARAVHSSAEAPAGSLTELSAARAKRAARTVAVPGRWLLRQAWAW